MSNPIKIIFRADGSPAIGMGHVIRSLALAETLSEGYDMTFATCEPSSFARSEIERIGISMLEISPENHIDDFLTFLKGDEIVVLDNYFFNTDFQLKIKDKGCKLICIDDIHDQKYLADVVINPVPGTELADYEFAAYTKLSLGLSYVLLRPAFYQQRISKKKSSRLEKALICFGGAGPDDLTIKVLLNLLQFGDIRELHAVVPNAFAMMLAIQEFPKVKGKSIHLHHSLDADAMVDLMSECDFGVVAASSVLYECLAVGLPVVTGFFVDNQKGVSKYFAGHAFAGIAIGDFNEQAITEKHLNTLRSKIGKVTKLIDGQAPVRLQGIFQQLVLESKVQIRKTTEQDMKLYFDWANDPITRMNSIHQDPIKWENHVDWFQSKLKDLTNCFYLFEKEGIEIGQVRLVVDTNQLQVNYSVAPDQRGKGFGQIILKLALEAFWKKNEFPISHVYGLVKPENKSSVCIFENLNFKKVKSVIKNGQQLLKFEKPWG